MTGPKASRSGTVSWSGNSPSPELVLDSAMSVVRSSRARRAAAAKRAAAVAAGPEIVCIGLTQNRGGAVMSKAKSPRNATEQQTAEISEAQIAVHWPEEDYFSPSNAFIAQANLVDSAIFERFSLDRFPECFKEFADLLDWYKYWETTFDASKPPFWRWFVGGKINACYNCVDRHLAKHKNKTAIHFVPEPENEAVQHVTYQE